MTAPPLITTPIFTTGAQFSPVHVVMGDHPDNRRKLAPAPFYPPTLARKEGFAAAKEVPPLPREYPSLPDPVRVAKHDEKDKGTPDEWVMREESMVRLTGKWPFNSEAHLTPLYNAGFLTPPALFYVRNHGPVPRVTRKEAEAWTLDIFGLVKRRTTLSLADLQDPAQFETVTLPITLVCAGNRRKEQNIVRKSLGFSWGPGGVSTALFTGVYLADVLEHVGIKHEGVPGQAGYRKAEHVIFEGAEDLPDGKYGTSQRIRWAKSKNKAMMLAWAMNGEPLEPDHGYPLRLVVPGQIGGRSVKWLKKIEVSDQESQHHLHFWDNKVLPSTVMPETARKERAWWYDPRYIITDLNTNSAIAQPAHEEELIYVHDSTQKYPLAGYAYTGGGRRISRVEVTLDGGKSWLLAHINYPEDLYRMKAYKGEIWGTIDMTERDECFCWVFWELELNVKDMGDARSIAIRAMDEGMAVQPSAMYWNATGMMNNWWYRVAIHKTVTSDTVALRFEHPTQPGTLVGGWMERLKDFGQDIANNPTFGAPSTQDAEIVELAKENAQKKPVIMTKEGVDRKITKKELEAHNTEEEPWFVVNGEVYDPTAFLSKHPGGAESITLVAGSDASEDFMAIHSPEAKEMLRDYHVGTLILAPSEKNPGIVVASSDEPDAQFLSKTKWKKAKLVNIKKINDDSCIFRFELEHAGQPVGLPVGQHVYARLRRKVGPGDNEGAVEGLSVQGELVQRAYTPVSQTNACGFLDLLIKIYRRTADFPDGGKMTLGFDELVVGEWIEFKGPLGSFQWLGAGMCRWRNVEHRVKNIGLICGGSGITPILQVLRAAIHDVESADTRLWLLNANRTEADILLREELDRLAHEVGPSRFQVHYCLSKAPEDWQHSRGRLTEDMLRQHLPPPGPDSLVLICGPDPMIEKVAKPGLTNIGWDIEKTLVIF